MYAGCLGHWVLSCKFNAWKLRRAKWNTQIEWHVGNGREEKLNLSQSTFRIRPVLRITINFQSAECSIIDDILIVSFSLFISSVTFLLVAFIHNFGDEPNSATPCTPLGWNDPDSNNNNKYKILSAKWDSIKCESSYFRHPTAVIANNRTSLGRFTQKVLRKSLHYAYSKTSVNFRQSSRDEHIRLNHRFG